MVQISEKKVDTQNPLRDVSLEHFSNKSTNFLVSEETGNIYFGVPCPKAIYHRKNPEGFSELWFNEKGIWIILKDKNLVYRTIDRDEPFEPPKSIPSIYENLYTWQRKKIFSLIFDAEEKKDK